MKKINEEMMAIPYEREMTEWTNLKLFTKVLEEPSMKVNCEWANK